MDSIQKLRHKAEAAGNLSTTAQQKVIVDNNSIEIEPVDPELVYVPSFNPVAVYGPWWWAAYPPLAYYPVRFLGAVRVGPAWGWGWGSWGWSRHNVVLNVDRRVNINTTNAVTVKNMHRNIRTTSLNEAVTSGQFNSKSSTWTGAQTRSTRTSSGGAAIGAQNGASNAPRSNSSAEPARSRQPVSATPSQSGVTSSAGQSSQPGATQQPSAVTPARSRQPVSATQSQSGVTSTASQSSQPGATQQPSAATPGRSRQPLPGGPVASPSQVRQSSTSGGQQQYPNAQSGGQPHYQNVQTNQRQNSGQPVQQHQIQQKQAPQPAKSAPPPKSTSTQQSDDNKKK